MTIDEVIKTCEDITNEEAPCPRYCMRLCGECVKEHEKIAEWLKELKRRREYDGEIIGSGALSNAYNNDLAEVRYEKL